MDNRVIVLCYRKVIDVNAVLPWEKLVFDESYLEFKMQFQNFNRDDQCHTFAELIRQRPDADRLHFLVSPSITGYIRQLQSRMPDMFDALGKHFLTFTGYRFELINSDIRDSKQHRVAISFYAEPLTWQDTIGNYLLLAKGTYDEGGALLTHLYQLQPFVSIHSLKLNT